MNNNIFLQFLLGLGSFVLSTNFAEAYSIYGAQFGKNAVKLHIPTCQNRDIKLEDLNCTGLAWSGVYESSGERGQAPSVSITCDLIEREVGTNGCAGDDTYLAWGKKLTIEYKDIKTTSVDDDNITSVQHYVNEGYLVELGTPTKGVVTKNTKVADADFTQQ